MKNEELSWSEIVDRIRQGNAGSSAREDSTMDQVTVFMVMLATCASATGRMPSRVAAGACGELVAYYLEAVGHAGIEVYPKEDCESWPEGVLFWARGELDHAEDVYYPDILDPEQYKVLVDFFENGRDAVLNESK